MNQLSFVLLLSSYHSPPVLLIKSAPLLFHFNNYYYIATRQAKNVLAAHRQHKRKQNGTMTENRFSDDQPVWGNTDGQQNFSRTVHFN